MKEADCSIICCSMSWWCLGEERRGRGCCFEGGNTMVALDVDADADIQKYRRDYGRDTEEEEVVADADDAADGQCWKEARKAMGGNSLATEEGVRDIQHLARNVAGRFLSLLPAAVTPRSLETFLTLSATNSSSMKRSNCLIQREGLVNSYESAPLNAEEFLLLLSAVRGRHGHCTLFFALTLTPCISTLDSS